METGDEYDDSSFRAEKHSKHARVRAMRQAPSLKKIAGISSVAFPIFPLSSNILTSLMESWCIVFVGIQFFSD